MRLRARARVRVRAGAGARAGAEVRGCPGLPFVWKAKSSALSTW